MAQEDARVSQAETVDTLLDVAHGEKVFPFTGDRRKDPVLHLVGILIFVHHDLTVALGDRVRQLRWVAVRADEQADRLMLLIGKIGRVAPPLFALIGAGKLPRQRDQRAHGRRHGAQVLCCLGAGCIQPVPQLFAGGLARIPKALHPHLQPPAVRILHDAKTGERHLTRARSVPAAARCFAQGVQVVRRRGKRRCIVRCKGCVLIHLCRGAAQQQRPVPRLAPYGAKKQRAIRRVLHVLRGRAPEGVLLCQPLLFKGLGLQLFVQFQHQLGQRAVIPSRTERVGQQCAAVTGPQPLVKAVQHAPEHALLQHRCILLVQHAEVRTQAVMLLVLTEQVTVLPQQRRAECVHGLNVGTV